ncbi:hypothetical protein EYF80_025856 [Liparis tanakae]|uniref:Uncharacterized protein n=1 Tax=Liparis tanakae TaxID=230148 RepID=A0A4Z2HG28_9TELE|nr:hypothetical protein EYF80_025856 [Liparis tanakae]
MPSCSGPQQLSKPDQIKTAPSVPPKANGKSFLSRVIVEQWTEQKEVPGPRGPAQIQTQQLSQLLLLTTAGGGDGCWQGFGKVGLPGCQALPVGRGPTAQSCYLALLMRTPPGLQSQAASMRYMPTGSLQTRYLTCKLKS